MANKHRSEVEIKLGGMDLVLKFATNGQVAFEDAFGVPTHEILTNIEKYSGHVSFLRALLYGGLRHNPHFKKKNKEDALEKIGDFIDTLTPEERQELSICGVKSFFLGLGMDLDEANKIENAMRGKDENPTPAAPSNE